MWSILILTILNPMSSPKPPAPTKKLSLYRDDKFVASPFWYAKHELDASKSWDAFYATHKANFFSDRRWFHREFPSCFASPPTNANASSSEERVEVDDFDTTTAEPSETFLTEDDHCPPFPPLPLTNRTYLEVGCGVGNGVFPIVASDPTAVVYCCDYSKRAIEELRRRKSTLEERDRERIVEFVCDITTQQEKNEKNDADDEGEMLMSNVIKQKGGLPREGVDVCTCVFVLSAIAPESMKSAISNIAVCLKSNGRGRVLVRDYAVGDLAEARFEKARRDGQKLGEHFYIRSDRTRAFFFSNEGLVRDFCDSGKFRLAECTKFVRVIKNRKDETEMRRRWIQASFHTADG